MADKKVIGFIDCGIFPGDILFACGMSHAEIVKYLSKSGDKEWISGLSEYQIRIDDNLSMGDAICVTVENQRTREIRHLQYIILTKFNFSDYHYCILAHEVLHICQFYLKDILNRQNETEAEAYFHTHVMSQCLELLRGKK